MKPLTVILALGALILTGCGSMSGLDAKTSFSCKAPDGVLCESMTGIYANAEANNLPGQRVNHKADAEPARQADSGVLTKPITSGTPIRTAPLVLRVWFAPWEDTDGDLHDQSYVYLTVDSGKWLIEHNRRRIRDAYRPVHAPSAVAPANGQGAIKVTPPEAPDTNMNGALLPGFPATGAKLAEQE
jgi:conjugal transfer pilus assembly protein TraV